MSIKAHVFAKGKKIYKGDTEQFKSFQKYGEVPSFSSNTKQPVFFALDADNADQYGVVIEFETLRDFHLVEIDNIDTMRELYEMVPPPIQVILAKNYGYNPKTNTFGNRNSEHTADNALSTYLCEHGYDGYIILSRNLKTAAGGHFHAELVICNDQDKIKFTRVVDTEQQITSKTFVPPKTVRKTGRRRSILEDEDEEEDASRPRMSSMRMNVVSEAPEDIHASSEGQPKGVQRKMNWSTPPSSPPRFMMHSPSMHSPPVKRGGMVKSQRRRSHRRLHNRRNRRTKKRT